MFKLWPQWEYIVKALGLKMLPLWDYNLFMPKTTKEKRAHTASMRVRLLPEHDEEIRRAAEHAGISLSDWLRLVLLRAAREELGE